MIGLMLAGVVAATPVSWVKQPTAKDVQGAFPKAALKAGLSAQVMIACRPDAKGRLKGCGVVRADVSGGPSTPDVEAAFGRAALKLADDYRAPPMAPPAEGAAPLPADQPAPTVLIIAFDAK